MRLTTCYFKPKSPLHLGEREKWQEGSSVFIHSDTLFSAFCNSYLLLYGEEGLSGLLQQFKTCRLPFLFSSAFPQWGNTYYFPVPKNKIPKSKETKKILFIEKSGFESLLAGRTLEEMRECMRTIPAQKQPYQPWTLENVPRVTLSRLSNQPSEDGGFFHSGQVTYNGDAGLFLLIHYTDDKWRDKLEAALRLLADEGIGGDRSVGKGLMDQPRFGEMDLDIPDRVDGYLSLSLYYPSPNEVENLSNGFYELIERKGYIYSPYGQSLRRRSVRMFAEGSVFPSDKARKGELVEVTPEAFGHHPVYRYGFFFGIPCKTEER